MDGFQSSSSGGVPKIQVFRPTWDEFKDFNNYIIEIEKTGAHRAGLAKVIPPPEWKPRADGYDMDIIGNIEIPAPISQVVQGKQGVYQQFNIQKSPMKVKDLRRMAESPRHCTPTHFDYEDLDRKYWRNINYFPPLYGADVSGSLTDPTVKEWNINKLGSILDYVNEDYGISIEGVNTAYLYFGMWKSSFAWHTEDMDLYSINYLHFGEPKSWYSIPPEHGARLERLANNFFPGNAKECPAYLRHKMTVISPMVLKNHSIPYNKIVQEAGEFMITFPYGYHAGFNHGFNCAESTNFASPRWVEYGKRATQCNCRPDMVKISMDTFVKRFQPERYDLWLQGKDVGPHPELPGKNSAAPHPSKEEILCNKNNPDLPDSFVEPIKKKAKRHLIHQQLEQEQQIKQEIKKEENEAIVKGTETEDSSVDGEPEVDEEDFELMKDIYYKAGEMESDCLDDWDNAKRKGKKSTKRIKSKLGKSSDSSDSNAESHNIIVKQRRIKTEFTSQTPSPSVGGSEIAASATKIKGPPPPTKMMGMLSHFRIPKKIASAPCLPDSDLSCWTEADNNASRILSGFANNVKQERNALSIKQERDADSINSQQTNLFIQSQSDSQDFSKTRIQTPSANSHIKSCPVATQRSPSPSTSQHSNRSLGPLKSSSHHGSPNREMKPNRSLSHSPAKVNRSNGSGSSEERRSRKQKCPRINRTGVDSRDLSANLTNMWLQQKDWTWSVEADFNLMSSRQDPHCCICSLLKPAVLQRSQQPEPSSSTVLLPEKLFGSDRTRGVSILLRCSSCRVCVHAKCYGVSETTSAMNWLCRRCERSDEEAKCCLCVQRGGALKSTTDSRWAHVLCALCFPGVFFGQPVAREPIVVDQLVRESVVLSNCVFCSGRPDCSNIFYRGICLPCSGSSAGKPCEKAFHPTCGLVNGVQFTFNQDGKLSGSCCSTTSLPPTRSLGKKKVPHHPHVGQHVYAIHPYDGTYSLANVVDNTKMITYYSVEFADGSLSNDTYPEDIQNYNCKADGPPPIGAAVDVLWSDNLHYDGYYRGKSQRLVYKLQFRDGSSVESERGEFYHPDEELPKQVREQIDKQTNLREHHGHEMQS